MNMPNRLDQKTSGIRAFRYPAMRHPLLLCCALLCGGFFTSVMIAQTDALASLPTRQSVPVEIDGDTLFVVHEAGVEIMSPHYANVRDGNQTTVPESYLPKSYQAPAFRLFHPGDTRNTTDNTE